MKRRSCWRSAISDQHSAPRRHPLHAGWHRSGDCERSAATPRLHEKPFGVRKLPHRPRFLATSAIRSLKKGFNVFRHSGPDPESRGGGRRRRLFGSPPVSPWILAFEVDKSFFPLCRPRIRVWGRLRPASRSASELWIPDQVRDDREATMPRL